MVFAVYKLKTLCITPCYLDGTWIVHRVDALRKGIRTLTCPCILASLVHAESLGVYAGRFPLAPEVRMTIASGFLD